MSATETPRPKPMAPKAKLTTEVAPVEAGVTTFTQDKPKFVRKPHLTERPLRNHDGLAALRDQLNKQAPRRNNKEKK